MTGDLQITAAAVVSKGPRSAATTASFPGPLVESGRGLAIISSLSAGHGTSVEGDRKEVWCTLDID